MHNTVALRKESVDRNLQGIKSVKNRITSLSARRAWIEILRAVLAVNFRGRSPQGERG